MSNIKEIDRSFFDIKQTRFQRFVSFSGFYFLYDIHTFFSKYYERITRSIAFAKIGWLNYDFESQFLYDLISFKLKRIQFTLKNYSHSVEDKESMLALEEAIEISDRLFAENYERKYLDEHNEKWGSIRLTKSIVTYSDGNGSSTTNTSNRAKVITQKDKDKESKDFNKCYDKGIADRSKDIYRFAEILEKYQMSWWD